MKFKAYVDQGHWTNQLHRLANAMGKGLEEAVRQQAGLVCLDAMRLTPPFPNKGGSKALRSSWAEHRKAGQEAVAKNIKMFYKPASTFYRMTREDRGALAFAELAKRNDIDGIRAKFSKVPSSLQRVLGVRHEVDAGEYNARRNRRGRIPTSERGFLLHSGRVPKWTPRPKENQVAAFPGLRALFKRQTRYLGLAKAGWAKACDALGIGRRVPSWIHAHKAKAKGIFHDDGTGPKYIVTAGSPVDYMQDLGGQLRIVQTAMAGRLRLMEKQIAMTLRKRKVVK